MIPKVEACLTSLEAGVLKTHIIDGRLPHALLLEIFTKSGIGTEIVRDEDSAAPTRPAGRYWGDLDVGLQIADFEMRYRRCLERSDHRECTQGDAALSTTQLANQSSQATIAQFEHYVIPNYRRYPGQPGEGRRVVDLGRRGQPLSRLLPGLGL